MPGYIYELGPLGAVLMKPNATMQAEPRRYSPPEAAVTDKKIAELLGAGILAAPITPARLCFNAISNTSFQAAPSCSAAALAAAAWDAHVP